MTEPVTCVECRHFVHDDINPEMGMGMCRLKRIGMYPEAPHYCRKREPIPEDHDVAR